MAEAPHEHDHHPQLARRAQGAPAHGGRRARAFDGRRSARHPAPRTDCEALGENRARPAHPCTFRRSGRRESRTARTARAHARCQAAAMIVLDTNVVSELMRTTPEPRVLRWLDLQAPDTVGVTAITVAEILYGIARLPQGARRTGLEGAAAQTFDEDLLVLPFDESAALDYAAI